VPLGVVGSNAPAPRGPQGRGVRTRAETGTGEPTRWPTPSEYAFALIAAEAAHSSGLTKGLAFERNEFEPAWLQGGAGVVFHATDGDRDYAFKLFSKQVPRRRERYNLIHDHLERAGSAVFVDFQFADEGLCATPEGGSARWYPAVRMEWCSGKPLHDAVEGAQRNGYDAEDWARRWLRVLDELRRTRTGHGDLQHENVMVGTDGTMRLIDYDGMFVPSMRGRLDAAERGHPAYQHPERKADGAPFDECVDGVSGLVILASLAGLTPELWRDRNPEGLVLGSDDLADPGRSELLKRLGRGPDPARELARLLEQALARPLGACPELDQAARLYGVSLPPIARGRSTARRRTAGGELPADSGDSLLPWELEFRGEPQAAPPADEPPQPSTPPRRPLTPRQVLTLASSAAGLEADELASLRGTSAAAVRRHLKPLEARLDGMTPEELLGFRLSRRQAEAAELRFARASEAESAERLGVKPTTARRYLDDALRRIDESELPGAQQLAAGLRARGETTVTVLTPPPPPPEPVQRPQLRPEEPPTEAELDWGAVAIGVAIVLFVLYLLFVR
jgi:hypothetical protein